MFRQAGTVPLRVPIQLDASETVAFDDLSDPAFVHDMLASLPSPASA
jgi:hypothetical protein